MPGAPREDVERLQPGLASVIVAAPVIVAASFIGFLWAPETRFATKWLLLENQPVQLLTFLALAAGGLLGLALAWRARRNGAGAMVFVFYAVFSAGLLFTAMEEVAWGQWFFGFETPPALERINRQDEMTLHNIRGIHGHSEYFRVAFAVGGLLGLCLSLWPRARDIAVPPLLASWFLVIAVLAGLDLVLDYYPFHRYFYRTIGVHMSEVVEMLIGFAALLYVRLNWTRLHAGWKGG